jgi:hypothetical protein
MRNITMQMKFYLGERVYYFNRESNGYVSITIEHISLDISKHGTSLRYHGDDGNTYTEKELFRSPRENFKR